MIEFACPSCGKRYKLEEQMAGKKAKCKCGNVLVVPSPTVAFDEPAFEAPAPPPVAARQAARPAPEPPPASQGAECPSCGAEMPPSAVLCVECGYDKRTGKRIAGL